MYTGYPLPLQYLISPSGHPLYIFQELVFTLIQANTQVYAIHTSTYMYNTVRPRQISNSYINRTIFRKKKKTLTKQKLICNIDHRLINCILYYKHVHVLVYMYITGTLHHIHSLYDTDKFPTERLWYFLYSLIY